MTELPFLVRRQREAVIVLAGLVLGVGAVAAAVEPHSPGSSFDSDVQRVPAVPFDGPEFQEDFEFEFEEPPALEPPAFEPPTPPEIEAPPGIQGPQPVTPDPLGP